MKEIFALKYRPRKLSDMVGQEHVAQSLGNSINANNLHHGYIFAGVFGTGKTSMARVFAASLNCEKGMSIEPCGKCKNCQEIFDGKSIDVKEMNAASNRGIDDMRALNEFATLSPLVSRYKIIIIDEAHGLTREAVESFLKLLEEPPARVIFILCTTEIHKLKETIVSRCIPFRFSKIQWPQITQHLKNVCVSEKIKADDSSLKLMAKLSKGSLRNSLQNLQLMKDFAGDKEITIEITQKGLGAIDDNKYLQIFDAILNNDPVSGIKLIQSIFTEGNDVEQVMNSVQEHLRNLLVASTCKNTSGLIFLSEDEKKTYSHLVSRMSINLIIDLIGLLTDIARGVNYNLNPQLLFEQFIVKSIIATARNISKQTGGQNASVATKAI